MYKDVCKQFEIFFLFLWLARESNIKSFRHNWVIFLHLYLSGICIALMTKCLPSDLYHVPINISSTSHLWMQLMLALRRQLILTFLPHCIVRFKNVLLALLCEIFYVGCEVYLLFDITFWYIKSIFFPSVL